MCTWGWSACAPTASLPAEQRAPVLPTSTPQGDKGSALSRASCEAKSECSTPSESHEAVKPSADYCQRTEHSENVSRDDPSSNGEILSHLPLQKLAGSKGPFRFDKIADSLSLSLLDMGELPSDDRRSTLEDNVISLPWLVSLAAGVVITFVAAGGRHTLALSGDGQLLSSSSVFSQSLKRTFFQMLKCFSEREN